MLKRISLFSSSAFIVISVKIMSGLSVEMLSSSVSHLASQGLTLQQGKSNDSLNIGHSGLSVASAIPIREDEVLVGKEEFTIEQLLSKQKRNGKATQAQQTFSVGNSSG